MADLWPFAEQLFLKAVTAAGPTPLISPLANATAIGELKPPSFSLVAQMKQMTDAAVWAVAKEKFGTRYGTLIQEGCLFCKDFALSFKQSGWDNLVESFFMEESEENPDLAKIKATIRTNQIDFLLLPNYSKFSGSIIAALQSDFPKLAFFWRRWLG